jgi:hypothetical protein
MPDCYEALFTDDPVHNPALKSVRRFVHNRKVKFTFS